MGSLAAENVAKEVLESVGKGKRPVLRKIIKKNGYAQNTADSPKQVTETKSYQRIISPLVQQLEDERQAILKRMPEVRDKAKYRDLSDALDKTTKVLQLLTGGATENIAVKPLATLEELRRNETSVE